MPYTGISRVMISLYDFRRRAANDGRFQLREHTPRVNLARLRAGGLAETDKFLAFLVP